MNSHQIAACQTTVDGVTLTACFPLSDAEGREITEQAGEPILVGYTLENTNPDFRNVEVTFRWHDTVWVDFAPMFGNETADHQSLLDTPPGPLDTPADLTVSISNVS